MYRSLIIFTSLVILYSCSSENNMPVPEQNNLTLSSITKVHETMPETVETTYEQSSPLYARVGKESISQADIDQLIQLQIYDLEWLKYDLRRKKLAGVVNEKIKSGVMPASLVEVFIEPPMPPRLVIDPGSEQPSYGNPSAPITLSIFCSYPSSHCASMTKTYDELLMAYQDQIKLVFFDFPQAFHFNAGHAARAARCANKAGQFWGFHKGLLANFDQLSETLFMSLARQSNIDPETFKACFDNKGFMEEVKSNLKLAEDLGFGKVPVTLINGLFINGPRSADTLRYFIDKELERLNIIPNSINQQAKRATSDQEIPLSQLPLRLEALTLGNSIENSTATIQHLNDETSRVYKQDEEILPKIYLVMIQSNQVIVEREGQLERILLSGGEGDNIARSDPAYMTLAETTSEPTELVSQKQGKSLADPKEIPAGLEYKFRGVVSPKGETPLSRTWLTEQLEQRDALKTHFEPAEHEVEGVYVMRLTNIQENDFYQTLGLQERDVILRVNNEWVHSTQNNIFETLEKEQEVSVVLMRKGLPVHLNYHIN